MQEWPIFKVVSSLLRDFDRFLQLLSEEFSPHKCLSKTKVPLKKGDLGGARLRLKATFISERGLINYILQSSFRGLAL